MSATDKAKNRAQIAKGRLKDVAGRATGRSRLQAEGKGERLAGHLKQASEKAKDAMRNLGS